MTAMDEMDGFVALACRLADTSGPILRHWFRTPLPVETKADDSPVTRADRETESALRALIESTFPMHGIVGEEYGAVRADAEHVWVIDPLDGTRAFVAGKPTFGTLVALLRDGRPIVGVIDMPILGERWVGARGRPTSFGTATPRTRACARLGDALLNATAPDMFRGPGESAAFERVRRSVRMNHWGGDLYGYGLLAAGFVDLVIEAGMQPYDYLALVPVIEGAGGAVTDWAGAPLGLASDGRVLAAATPSLHAEARALLAGG